MKAKGNGTRTTILQYLAMAVVYAVITVLILAYLALAIIALFYMLPGLWAMFMPVISLRNLQCTSRAIRLRS